MGLIRQALNKIDIFGKPINMNFDGKKSHITTVCGGVMTVLLVLTAIGFSIIQLIKIITHDETHFTSSIFMNDLDEIAKKTFDEFDDSFNFMIDIRNETFDWFNNPYIYPNVYHIDQNLKPKLHPTIRMEKCDKTTLRHLIPEHLDTYYPNSICFEDKSKI